MSVTYRCEMFKSPDTFGVTSPAAENNNTSSIPSVWFNKNRLDAGNINTRACKYGE